MALRSALLFLSALPFIVTDKAVTPIHKLRTGTNPTLSKRQTDSSGEIDPSSLFSAYNISVPIDHFSTDSQYEPHLTGNFNLRYWFDDTHYKEGGPVIMLASGEDTGVDRLPYLQKGIVHQIAEATGGIAVVLEHRFYGTSIPTSDLSTESLRYLTTEQALADTAYFAQNVVFEGRSENLTAPNVPWIAYGGSYAGAFVAFLRTTYPNIFFGAIASSAVTEAVYDFWEYYTPIQTYGPTDCIYTTQLLINIVDNILINEPAYTGDLMAAFGLANLTYTTDFVNILTDGVGNWQGRNWDPAVNNTAFALYCGNISSNTTIWSPTSQEVTLIEQLIGIAAYGSQPWLVNRMLNFLGWIYATEVLPCTRIPGETLDECFSTQNATFYAQDDISQTWRSWPYQECSQWGFFTTGSGTPQGQLPLVSRTLDIEYQTAICRDAFNITEPANTNTINAYGGYNISYSRLAFIDGQADPWRGATVHADGAPARASTASEPSIVIVGAVHHWDENGLFPNETTSTEPPTGVAAAQANEASMVQAWLQEFTKPPYSGSSTANTICLEGAEFSTHGATAGHCVPLVPPTPGGNLTQAATTTQNGTFTNVTGADPMLEGGANIVNEYQLGKEKASFGGQVGNS